MTGDTPLPNHSRGPRLYRRPGYKPDHNPLTAAPELVRDALGFHHIVQDEQDRFCIAPAVQSYGTGHDRPPPQSRKQNHLRPPLIGLCPDPFGAACCRADAVIDDAIQMVRAFDDRDEAVACASTACGVAEQWAVVDLTSMTVTARGSRPAA